MTTGGEYVCALESETDNVVEWNRLPLTSMKLFRFRAKLATERVKSVFFFASILLLANSIQKKIIR